MLFSFYYTEKIALLMRQKDPIYETIEDVVSTSNTNYVNAIIDDKTIIPGMNGLAVNVDKSFQKMKSFGAFNKYYLIFDQVKPEISLEDHKDKMITNGNSKKRMVSFILEENENIAKYLKENNIEVLTIKDIGINLKPEETGKNAIENAYIKAKAYYDKTKITTIGMDNNLYIEELPEEKQPGTHVRRVNGKELNDDEMIEHYCNLVKEYGGKLTAKWVYGMVIYDGKEPKEYSWSKSHFYFVDKPCEKRNPGYPLDSMSIMPECNKYFVDLTEEEWNKNTESYKEDDVINFIVKNCSK